MKTLFTLLACSILFSNLSVVAETYDARVAEKQILTPVPPTAPRINGPVVCGARPGNPFLYRIPTQGERPIRFEVKDLPEGLKQDADKGIITGKTPARKGDHLMTITAKNGHGETSRPFKLVVGEKLALTPKTNPHPHQK
jgi:alpha-galactosidase